MPPKRSRSRSPPRRERHGDTCLWVLHGKACPHIVRTPESDAEVPPVVRVIPRTPDSLLERWRQSTGFLPISAYAKAAASSIIVATASAKANASAKAAATATATTRGDTSSDSSSYDSSSDSSA